MNKIFIDKQKILESPLQDFSYLLSDILSHLEEDASIILEKDSYDLNAKFASERFCFISNNDSGLKKIGFLLEGKKNIIIDGQGSNLNCVGRILPFYFSNCQNITLKNFTIDYHRPFMSQGKVMKYEKDYFDLQIDQEEYPFEFRGNKIRFIGEEYIGDFVHGFLEFNEDKRPIPTAFDSSINGTINGKLLENGHLRIFFSLSHAPKLGSIMTIKHEMRLCPTITLDSCKNVNLENIWIKQSGAMAVIAQLSENIHLNKVDVYPDEQSSRVFSANADATHFVNCSGEIIVEHGRYESMLDDVINVHGNYLRVEKVLNSNKIMVCIPHFQQEGFLNFRVGDHIEICEQNTMMGKGNSKVKCLEKINQKYYLMTLEQPFEFDDAFTYCIDNVDMHPKVIFRSNICGKNRARGLILTSTKETIVENNVIDSEGSAIKVNSDMKNWYESAAISKLIVRNNKLTRKNHGNWGVALIDIDPGMKEQVTDSPFHGHMLIEHNEILLEESPLFFGYSFETIYIQNNQITVKNEVKAEDWDFLVQTENRKKVTISENIFLTESGGSL
ncbi:MAG: hypothetical protein R3Y63_11310 [Eubacteriales bacterium]